MTENRWTRARVLALTALRASAARVLALAALANLCIDFWWYGAPSLWCWVSLHWLPTPLAAALVVAFAASVLLWGSMPRPGRGIARATVGGFAALCAVDAVGFASALADGEAGEGVAAALGLPSSAGLAAVLTAWALWPPDPARRFRLGPASLRLVLDATVAGVGLLLWCLAVGHADERRPADAIVVYGAGVGADGTPSPSLRERTLTGCALYRQGLARHLVLSGGHAPDVSVSEPEVMRRLARDAGVPEAALTLDEAGTNTLATVRNCAALARERGWSTFLMVSHDYHLLRIRMFCRRAGLRAHTVPADEGAAPRKRTVWLRELAALVVYYFQPGP